MTQKPIDVEALQQSLLKKPTRSRTKKVIDTTIRTYTLFFKLDRENGECENPDCQDPRRNTEKAEFIRVVTIRNLKMCRHCFLRGFGGE